MCSFRKPQPALAICVALALSAGCATDPNRPSSLWQRREPTDDVAAAQERVEGTPTERRAGILLASARTLEMDGQWDQAGDVYRKILAADPQQVEAAHRLAIWYCRQGRFDQAESLYRMCLERDPNNAELICDLGYACYLQGRWAEAEQHFDRALDLAPSLRRARMNRGILYARSGRTAEALSEFSKAGCTRAQAKANVAFAAMMSEDWDTAIAYYQQALGQDPKLDKATAGLQTAQRVRQQGPETTVQTAKPF